MEEHMQGDMLPSLSHRCNKCSVLLSLMYHITEQSLEERKGEQFIYRCLSTPHHHHNPLPRVLTPRSTRRPLEQADLLVNTLLSEAIEQLLGVWPPDSCLVSPLQRKPLQPRSHLLPTAAHISDPLITGIQQLSPTASVRHNSEGSS